MDRKQGKHHKVHLLIISETGKVKTRKLSVRFVKVLVGVFAFFFILTSVFTYLYLKNLQAHRHVKAVSDTFIKKSDELRGKIEEQSMEIKRLRGVIARLNMENKDLKQHIISRKVVKKKAETSSPSPPVNKNLEAYRNLFSKIENFGVKSPAVFKIRDPQIDVSETVTKVSFKLYKNTLKKMYGRLILIGIYKPEDPETVGKVVAFPKRGVVNFKIRPGSGRYFKIERQFLPVEAKLLHPEGVSRFSEFHVIIYGINKKLLFHEKFEAP